MTTTRARSTAAALGLTAAMGLGVLATTAAVAAPPGNNGTLKVHELGTPANTESNDPKVCKFNFEVYGLDAGQDGLIKVAPQGGDTDTTDTVEVPLLATDDNGDGQTVYVNADPDGETDGLTLEDGHYKATLYNKFGTEEIKKAKSKVFKVICDEPTQPPTTTSTSTQPPTSTTTSSTSTASSSTSSTSNPTTPSTTGSTTTEPSSSSSSSSTSSSTTGSTGSTTTPGDTTTPPPGGTTPPPSGPPVQTDWLLLGSNGSNTVLTGLAAVVLGLVVGAAYWMRRRLTD
ncbi:hypothetical protein [Luteipulveratus mongoliensis]|uniref:Gram-positive cocci surface proteins LPxTG domain-containing protein n=1 Tax=Luteipulveratus mongoliensis TaxID=571913 RepID=A0A0K1JK95_9MICO|nr:hypothetical protein [Luteipulveratus mongoliensis]AKU17008.1 hypothetical protein VV02_15980 [Luteipulveratus mongoliensis]